MSRNLTQWLLYQALRTRDLVRLSMAFRVSNPEWGSQSVLATASLFEYLNFLDWDIHASQDRFPDWYEQALQTHDPYLLSLRANTIKALADLAEDHRHQVLTPAEDPEDQTDLARLLVMLANRGLLLWEVLTLVDKPREHPATQLLLPDLSENQEMHGLLRAQERELALLNTQDYIGSVSDSSRGLHPNVLYANVIQVWRVVANMPMRYQVQMGTQKEMFPESGWAPYRLRL